MDILKLINTGAERLKINNILSYRLDSEILLSNILNRKREELLINLNEKVSVENIKQFQSIISRRSLKEPIAYILKKRSFGAKILL